MQIVLNMQPCKYITCLDNCSNYVSSKELIIQITSLLHLSIYLLPEQECVAHISVLKHVLNANSLHLHLPFASS